MTKSIYLTLTMAVLLAIPARAQYGGGGGTGGTGTSTTSTSGGYGGGGKTAALVAAYAAAGGIVYAILLTRPKTISGCLTQTSQGLQIISDKDKKVYALESSGIPLQAGTRVELRGKKSSYGAARTFKVKKLVKEKGPCTAAAGAP